jgi:23S rRNA (uracil1939-C5)-methyltransferase
MYVINAKPNDSISDQEVILFSGKDHMMEKMEDLYFKVGPKSFYQTNHKQSYELYKVAREMAALTGTERVYDLYTGTGTIANFVARQAKEVIGIEYVEPAIEDARINSEINGITNTQFFAGDMVKVLDDQFVDTYGKPDVIITDPPRAGMHPKVVELLSRIEAQRIVYVSCNSATQARDVQLLLEKYDVAAIQPVDMFPQTHHVENVILLTLKKL